MNFPHPLDHAVRYVYGEPYQTPDGATVITVAKVRRRRNRGPGDGDPNVIAEPMGVFVVRGEQASWVAALDANRMGLIGVLTGLVAAVIGSLAVLRRPPWPDLSGGHRHGR
jgi:hypothetical protein